MGLLGSVVVQGRGTRRIDVRGMNSERNHSTLSRPQCRPGAGDSQKAASELARMGVELQRSW